MASLRPNLLLVQVEVGRVLVPVLVQQEQVLRQVPLIHQVTFLRGHRLEQPHLRPLSLLSHLPQWLRLQYQFRL